MLDKLTAQNLAKELKIDLFTVYREHLQLLFLKCFYGQKETENVCFKGGTCLRLLFGSFRFSEDLDFTALVSEKKARDLVRQALKNLKREIAGIDFKETETIANSFSGRIFQTIEGFNFPLTVRIDFSFREKPFLTKVSFLETIFPVGPYPQVVHLQKEELLAEKVRAILTRTKGRDLFDLWFLLSQKTEIDWQLVNKKMALYGKIGKPEDLIAKIKNTAQKEIDSDLTRFLPVSHRELSGKLKNTLLEKLA